MALPVRRNGWNGLSVHQLGALAAPDAHAVTPAEAVHVGDPAGWSCGSIELIKAAIAEFRRRVPSGGEVEIARDGWRHRRVPCGVVSVAWDGDPSPGREVAEGSWKVPGSL